MNVLIQLETQERTDHSSLVAAVVAYVSTFARAAPASPPRFFDRMDRSGPTAITFYEFDVDGQIDADELSSAIGKFVREVRRRAGLEAEVVVLVGSKGDG